VQLSLFQTPGENPPIRQAIEFYRHKHGWSNRLIAGDSLLVMNSLLEKEELAGQVQMIYIDPPYGIKYGSNFQPFVNKRDVKDGKDEDLTAEPEQIRAFRDTWELGIHSYLTYLRDRLLLARELLHESGSVFVQISDENVHHVRELMDEVFGVANFVSIISFRKTTGQSGSLLSDTNDYLIWYAKNKSLVKFRSLFLPRVGFGWVNYDYVALPDGTYRKMTRDELENPDVLPKNSRIYRRSPLTSASSSETTSMPVEFQGRIYLPGKGGWKTNERGFANLIAANRLEAYGTTLSYRRYADDFPYFPVSNAWTDTASGGYGADKIYVVQTNLKVIERCLLMTTDPGDLVFDPTCVRKGTRVLTPPNPPVSGGEKGSPCLVSPPSAGGPGGVASPSSAGGPGGVAIESLRPGDLVLSHDGQSHPVKRVIAQPYTGKMIGIRHALNDNVLWLTADHRVLIRRRRYEMSGKRDWSHTPPISFTRARELRHNLTPAEQLLWSRLRGRQLGAKFRKQHPIGPYIVDFYCAERALIIEVDGDSHFTPEGIEHDVARTDYLTATGLSIVRFTNDEVRHYLGSVMQRIQAAAGEPAESFHEEAWWLEAESLRCGDVIYCGTERQPVTITEILTEETSEDVYDLEVEGAHSFITDVCTVHNCGGGTTAYVAEQWGRRWITCDTSRVALTLARQRLMTAVYDYYELAHSEEGVGSGFKYKTVPHVTLKSIANDEPPGQETLYDQPLVDRKITRVSGPFTVEAVPAPAVRSVDDLLTPPTPPHAGGIEGGTAGGIVGGIVGGTAGGIVGGYVARTGETLRQAEWRDELLKTGLRGKAGQHIRFARLEPLPGCRWLHADGETRPSAEGADSVREDAPAYTSLRAVVSFGPQHAPLEQRQVASALEEAQTLVPRPKLVIFAAFQFDPEAAKDIDETRWPGVTLLRAQINADLLTDDLKKKRASNESFWLIGQPDVRLLPSPSGRGAGGEGLYQVEVLGFDYYNTKTGNIESGGADQIAVWLLDTDYDGHSLFPRQVFFPLAGENEGWARLARVLKAEIDPDLIEAYRGTVSLPFAPGEHRRIAVKIVDDRGIESMKVVRLDE